MDINSIKGGKELITYRKCSEVDFDAVYEVFQGGFSDYIIKFDISKEDFKKRFFGPEGNQLDYSYIAFDGEKPIGLILGGIKNYEGRKTLRCGTMCVHPDYRRKGISQKLFEYHKEVAIDNNCKQLFLEVISNNYPAFNLYKKLGYEKVYDLKYFTLKDVSEFKKISTSSFDIRAITLEEIKALKDYIYDIHINWQNDFDYIKKLENEYVYGAYENERLIGALSVSNNGKIHFLWVYPKYRNKKIASSLIKHAILELDLTILSTGFPNNASLEGFLKRVGFQKEKLSQYEMYKYI